MTGVLAILLILVGLELVLGADKILVIAIFVADYRRKARLLGLAFALGARVLLLLLLRVTRLADTLPAGVLFPLWKAVKERHHTVELN